MKLEYRGYLIQTHKKFPQNLSIAKAGKGGSISTRLTGMYTDVPSAQTAIDQVEDSKPVRGKSNAKTKSDG